MIRESDESGGRNHGPFNAKAVITELESQLHEIGERPRDKVYEAQQLVYDAWESATEEEEEELMIEALKIDPLNVDALLYMLDTANPRPDEEITALRHIVSAGESGLGAGFFKKSKGHFWGMIETRPYVRARQRLAEALLAAGQIEQAIAEYESILELNPNDNQGVRYHLLPCYLMMSRLEPARKLFTRYDECQFNTVFAWCLVLERFLAGEADGARAALEVARDQNPHTQMYIKGHRALPRSLPDSYSPGSKEEAVCFAALLRQTWQTHPAALKWLMNQKGK